MGDWRASIKITMSMLDVEGEQEFWINWFPCDEYGGLDRRPAEFMLGIAEKAISQWRDDVATSLQQQHEDAERTELQRLLDKYGLPDASQ